MAIKISGTTVIDDSQNICNIGDLSANGTVNLNGVVYPTADGSAGQVLKTDGSGTLEFAADGYSVDVQEFTSSGTWTKPEGATFVKIEILGGGNGGQLSYPSFYFTTPGCCNFITGGGGGGGFYCETYKADDLANTVCVSVGAGGLGYRGSAGCTCQNATLGGTTCFGSYAAVGAAPYTRDCFGGGGQWTRACDTCRWGAFNCQLSCNTGEFGWAMWLGSKAACSLTSPQSTGPEGNSYYGGGGSGFCRGGGPAAPPVTKSGGNSYFGGGGGGHGLNGPGGCSICAGNGGQGRVICTTPGAACPGCGFGGGGGGVVRNATCCCCSAVMCAGDGAPGCARITSW